MLQQILEKMYIDPDLLEELSDEQKQMLFYKMRQEQIRKWKAFDEKMDEEERKKPRKPTRKDQRKVDFMKGKDGCEWVWVMGEHPNDKTIEQILEEEEQATARKQAEEEARVQREKEEVELHRKMEEERERIIREKEAREAEIKRKQEEAALYQSLKEARLAAEKLENEKKKREEEERKRLAEIEEQEKKARRRSRELADSMKEKRSSEIYSTLQKKRHALEKLAEEDQKTVETNWKEQEKKAKEAEVQMRDMARKARVEYSESLRRSFTLMQAANAFGGTQAGSVKGSKPALPPKKHLMVTSSPGMNNKKPRPLRPKNRDMVISWFQKEEKDRGSITDPTTKKIAVWFHGIINRAEAEKILEGQPDGSYLIRVSERVWGYTLSYKECNRYKHFLIDASDLGYQFFGADQTMHESLTDLIQYHKDVSITVAGQEKLLHPCGQIVDPPDYTDLFQKKNGPSQS